MPEWGEKLMYPEAIKRGLIVDKTCYPWVAYKGERRNPYVLHWCWTEAESLLFLMLKRLFQAEFDRGSWPTKEELEKLLKYTYN